ncbi:MAG: DNA repair protein RecN [Clostridiales bacterium]|nr:DNA repair protein RecN [Clostridiales bacterium]
MIRSLHIKNLALISKLDIEFDSGLNVLSGETGAGKSIIVDSLTLLLGGRYDKTFLRYGEKSGYVEGVFDCERVKNEMAQLGLDEDDTLIVTRNFNAEGRNDIRLNGRSVTLSMLRKITPKLIDICGQNEHQSLSNIDNHIRVLDYYVRHKTAKSFEKLEILCQNLKETNKFLEHVGDAKDREKNIDFLKFQIEEIEKANVKENEEEELVALRKKYFSAETVCDGLKTTANLLTEDDDVNVSSLLYEAVKALRKIEKYGDEYSSLLQRLNDLSIEIEDVSETAKNELDSMDFSDEDLDKLEKRLETVRNISRKYGSGKNLIDNLTSMKEKLNELENADELYEKRSKEKRKLLAEIYEISSDISLERKKGAVQLKEFIEKELATLGMQSEFEIKFNEFPSIENCEKFVSTSGMDSLEFYLSPNVGQPLNPLVKIISGGELSRLMLALKVVSSNCDGTPTMIFDEIDTGISGKIGLEVAKKLAVLSKNHQLLCVTHLPQICAMADKNLYISKSNDGTATFTNVKALDEKDVAGEIARLTGGADISEQSLQTAKEMKEWSNSFKKTI